MMDWYYADLFHSFGSDNCFAPQLLIFRLFTKTMKQSKIDIEVGKHREIYFNNFSEFLFKTNDLDELCR